MPIMVIGAAAFFIFVAVGVLGVIAVLKEHEAQAGDKKRHA